MKNKFNYWVVFWVFSLVFFAACNDEDDDDLLGDWWKASSFEGIPRSDAVGFTINDKGYVGTGFDGENWLVDFWEYDPDNNYWVQKADFPGAARNSAVGFGTSSKGYIGTGYDGEDKLNDFYEYNPSTNEWIRKTDYPGTGRIGAVGFAINDKGYIGFGYDDNYLKDFYEYNPSEDSWEKIPFIGDNVRDAAAFVIGNKGYLVTGVDNGTYSTEFYSFDQATGDWTQLRDITNSDDDNDYDNDYKTITRINAVACSANGKGYVLTGSGSSLVNNVWEYNPSTDLWEEKSSFEGASRTEAVGFGIGNYIYVTTGRSSSYYFYDMWKFDPTLEYDDSEKEQ